MIRCAFAEIFSPLVSTRRLRSSSSSSVSTFGSITTPLPITQGFPGMQDPRRHQVKLPRVAVAHDRVPGVVTALKAHDGVGLLGEQVGDLALSLVAPLGADDRRFRAYRFQCTWAGDSATVAPMDDEQQTELLKAQQREREATEEQLARQSDDQDEAAQHERRAEKAHYLRRKLEERAASERD